MLISKFDLYKREWLDLVFADRNKSYGAYELRSHSGDYMMRALAITVLGFTTAFITITLATKHDVVPNDPIVQIIPDIPIPKILPIKEKPIEAKLKPLPQTHTKPVASTPPAMKVPMTKWIPPVVTNGPEAVDPPKMSELERTAIGPQTVKGEGTAPQNVTQTGPGVDGGKEGIDAGTGTAPVEVGLLDALPEPIGGTAAWSKFLQRTLRYPSTEAQGRVIISFVVEKDGSLTDITVLKGVSPELDNEALRVLKKAPAWKPGIQNGRPVRVKFTVPIVFQLTEQ
ncbi:energy transducer TonB [Mucilaginibacter lacusdianchii]|uniref:energy transducer TonB n=1 Tax=Mucilaginibacter lacusdianchii TaxID=2684211 RepID=UPI00131AF2FE|nr:energy transducer TonB [Mucilaginibacter sp. JXJ CY 39]